MCMCIYKYLQNNRPAATWGHCGHSVMMRQTNAIHQDWNFQPGKTAIASNNKMQPPNSAVSRSPAHAALILGCSALVGKETPG